MKKVYKESQLMELKNLQPEVNESIKTTIDILSKNYGTGLMSIFWTQKVKLFYAALLANNSH